MVPEVRERENGGTLDYPSHDGFWKGTDSRESSSGGNQPTHSTYMLANEEKARWGGKACPKCGTWNQETSITCSSCGGELGKRIIVDMRFTLEQAPRGMRAVQGMDAQRVKTSYKSGVLSARTEQEGVKPVPTPLIPPAAREKIVQGRKASKYNVYLAAAFIALIIILIVVFVLLIAGYL